MGQPGFGWQGRFYETPTSDSRGHPLLGGGFAAAQERSAEYLKVVQLYADTMIEHGRDRYGPVQSPRFAATLDIEKLSLFPQRPPSIKGVSS